MNLVEIVAQRMTDRNRRVLMPESDDRRVLEAAAFMAERKLCTVQLVGDRKEILERAAEQAVHLPENVDYISFQECTHREELIQDYYRRQKHKGVTLEEAEAALTDRLYFAASLVAGGHADGCVAGSVAATSEVVRAALKCIGIRDGNATVSSTFLMDLGEGRTLTYGDCGVVPYPDSGQLADIAIESARSHRLLTDVEPKVAMLSFSTWGSARHERVELVCEALELVRAKAPGLKIDGELQFDAAYLPEVAERKAPGSEVAGKANVFIFPNLDAGNIAYKITERLAGAEATGPILQGLAKPMMDLSRGCNSKDIVNAACVALLMGGEDT